jgi:hypothetical protein
MLSKQTRLQRFYKSAILRTFFMLRSNPRVCHRSPMQPGEYCGGCINGNRIMSALEQDQDMVARLLPGKSQNPLDDCKVEVVSLVLFSNGFC